MNRFQDKAVAKCFEYEERLTDWKIQFLHNLADNYSDEFRSLSEKQVHVLHRILRKVEFGD